MKEKDKKGFVDEGVMVGVGKEALLGIPGLIRSRSHAPGRALVLNNPECFRSGLDR